MRRPAVLALLLALAAPAAALADATSSQQGPSHDGAADGPGPPLGKRWERPVGGTVGTPLVAEGRVFVVTGEGSASSSSSSTETAQLRALALDSGRELWARAVERGSNGLPVGLAYDGGRVLALENGAVRAYDAASGALAWTVRPAGEEPEEGSSTRRGPRFTSIPVAAGGTVYVIGTTPPGPSGPPGPGLPVGPTQPRPAPSPLSLFQLRLSDGAVTRLSGYGGPDGDSTVHGVGLDGERAYVSAGCGDAEAFDRASGERRWTKGVTTSSGSSSSSCSSSGFGLLPPAVAGEEVFVSGGGKLVVRAIATGDERASVSAHSPAALAGGLALLPQERELLAQARPGGLTRWSWRPSRNDYDGPAGAPIVAGGHVFVRHRYSVIALRLGDGGEAWRGWVRSQSVSGGSSSGRLPGLAAGGGHLVVPSGSSLTAFWNGPDSPGLSAKPPLGGELELAASRSELVFGQATTLSGQFSSSSASSGSSGLGVAAGNEIVLEADPWPYEGGFTPVATTKAGEGGGYSFAVKPERNTLYRVVDPSFADAVSEPVRVLSDYGALFARPKVRGRTVSLRLRLFHSPQQPLAGRAVHFYLLRGTRAYRKATRKLRRAGAGEVRANARYRTRPKRGDASFWCVREPDDDGYGKRYRFDAACGRKTLSRRLLG